MNDTIIFGVFHTCHLFSDRIPSDDIYTSIWDEQPIEHETKPRIPHYRETTRPGAIINQLQQNDGAKEDLDKAVAARKAFSSFFTTTADERIELLERIAIEHEKRKDDIIHMVTKELGVPLKLSEKAHYNMGLHHYRQAAKELEFLKFEEKCGDTLIRKEPIGVSGLITPWNFPTNQTSRKLASAIAAGVHKGVFNLVNGTGEVVGNGVSSHPDIDFVSFTGSGFSDQKISENAAK